MFNYVFSVIIKISIYNMYKSIYPQPDNKDLQKYIYEKLEFNVNKLSELPKLKKDSDIMEYREFECQIQEIKKYQITPSIYINPYTPYKGLFIFFGTGAGKTLTAITIAENFKEQVLKYNTKIYILTPGPNLKDQWKDEIIKFTGNTYLPSDKKELTENYKKILSIQNLSKIYKIMSYKSFHRKVLGERSSENIVENNIVKKKYKKNIETGEIQREYYGEKIENLNNTLLIIDEAHNFTGNSQGNAVKKILQNSINLRIILLTATPMKNLASDIIDLINFVRPIDSPIKRDLIFTSDHNYNIKIKESGIEYFKEMINGYVSYYRGAHPLTFANRVDVGKIPKQLLFTKLFQCHMFPFQLTTYNSVIHNIDSSSNIESDDDVEETSDILGKTSEAVANFIFPILDGNNIIGTHGISGLDNIKSLLKTNNKEKYLKKLKDIFFDKKTNENNILYESANKSISGLILHENYIKHFSTKFYHALKNLNNLINDNVGTAFIYSNLVKIGIELFQETLLQNGYIQFSKNTKYNISDVTRCYLCGIAHSFHKNSNKLSHAFYPATFIVLTGQLDDIDDKNENITLIKTVFNNVNNATGKFIKFVLGSRVMNEGITLSNIKEVHILDAYYTLGRIQQVIGRAIRFCKHFDVTSIKNIYPTVNVYKYVITLSNNTLSSDEDLYRKAELKFINVKKIERILKETAIDCPLNYNNNIFSSEVSKYKKCIPFKTCPENCDLMHCDFKCYSKSLNLTYFNSKKNIYSDIKSPDLSSVYITLLNNEINYIISIIKNMYMLNNKYTISEIENFIIDIYNKNNKKLFDKMYIYIALDKLLPITQNDINNFTDIIYNKHNHPGYLYYKNGYYVFISFYSDNSNNIMISSSDNQKITSKLTIKNFINHFMDVNIIKEYSYNFNNVIDYYNNRINNDIIGIIDKDKNNNEVFKIKYKNILNQSFTGSTCTTTYTSDVLSSFIKLLNINTSSYKNNKLSLCNLIKTKLFELEKYSKNNTTYIIIPKDHPIYPFPINIFDRSNLIIDDLNYHKLSDIDKKEFNDHILIYFSNISSSLPSYIIDKYVIEKDNNKYLIRVF